MLSRIGTRLLPSIVVSLIITGSAAAQCAMCKATLSGDPNAMAAAHRMNMAVLLLLIPAIVLFTGFFVLMYRYRNSFRSSPPIDGFESPGDDRYGYSDLRALPGSTGPECR